MRSWVFRNRRRLETIYGSPGRGRPLLAAREAAGGEPADRGGPGEPRLLAYEIIPFPRGPLRRAG